MPFNFLVQLAISAVFFVVGELLRPKPDFEDAEALPFEQARIPQVNPERKQPVLWGKDTITSPHVMDVTEYNTVAIKKKVKTGLFSSDSVVVGHRYFFGVQLGLCKGTCRLRKIFYDDQLLWEGTSDATANTTGYVIDINEPDFLGGREQGGGIIGRFRFFGGASTHQVDPYLAQFQTPTPAYRWTSFIVMENVEVGETPNIEAFSFELDRYVNPLGLSGANNVIGEELNPMSMLAEMFTDADWGFNRPTEINTSAFTAAALTLATEANGLSLVWANNQNIERLVEVINKQVDSVLRFNLLTGLWEPKLLRNDFVFANLPVLDQNNIAEFDNFTRAHWSETVNHVEVKYTQRGSPENPPPAIAQDRSNFRRQGRHRVLSLQFPGVKTGTLAQQLAGRELRTNGFPFSSVNIIVDRTGWDLLPGDAFRLQWPPLGIDDLVMRVGSIGFGDAEQTEIQIGAIEDIFSLAQAVFSAPPSSLFTSVNPPPAVVSVFDVFDQPYFFGLNDQLRTEFTSEKPLIVAQKPQGNALEYQTEARQGGNPFTFEDESAYTPTGVLAAGLTESDGSNVSTWEISSLTVNSVSDAAILSSVAGDEDIRATGLNLALIISTAINPLTGAVYEPELVGYDSVTVVGSTVTLNNVHRGLGDTLPLAANAGDRVWFLTGNEIDGPGTTGTTYGDAENVDVRLTNVTTVGLSAASSSQNQVFRNRMQRPWVVSDLKINNVRFPAAQPNGSDLSITWRNRDRTLGRLPFQEDSQTIETDQQVRLRIYNDDTEALLRTELLTGTSFNYTLALQTADGGPFTNYRVEARVQDTATGTIFSLVTHYRTVSILPP